MTDTILVAIIAAGSAAAGAAARALTSNNLEHYKLERLTIAVSTLTDQVRECCLAIARLEASSKGRTHASPN